MEGGSLVMSVDRIGVMRPTKLCKATTDGQMWVERPGPANMDASGAGGGLWKHVSRPEWRTSRNWLHWDQNPWLLSGKEPSLSLLVSSGSIQSGRVILPYCPLGVLELDLTFAASGLKGCDSTRHCFEKDARLVLM